ncbi:hypothetical protein GCM10007862_35520 [Dyella lipolytica]|nr:hypothetical protein GCM10007862_35520 [Dyella lipolytica]
MSRVTANVDSLRDFELHAIHLMADDVLTPEQFVALHKLVTPANYEYTGCGYYLTVRNPSLPEQERTVSVPVVGRADDIVCGFLLFLGNNELTLECHTWGPVEVPADFRDRAVRVDFPDPGSFVRLSNR